MKFLLFKAAALSFVIGSLANCSGPGSAPEAPAKLLTKAQAAQHSTTRTVTSSSPSSSAWSHGPNGKFLPANVDVGVKSSSSALPKDKHGRPTYTSQSARHRFVRTTAYSCKENEVGAYGNLNAIGTPLKYGQVRSAAADWSRYPVGTTFKIKGLPYTYVIDDYGSALVGTNTIDIYHPNLSSMNAWATRDVEIHIVKWGSWERTASLLKRRTKYSHCAKMYYAAMRKLNNLRLAHAPSEDESPASL